MCGLPLWYFYSKETPMNKQLEAILKQVDLLPVDQQRELLRILQLLLPAPPSEPGKAQST
ncbi:MAG: hypothetical protein A4E52_00571 [Pelotomaculum sp. PtaB.Bin013]|uniref:Uncharacterized protein n=1 Tax=Pelotomaculum isophthalicicum JI TaxID=947010 RepID=A0A9X4H714_9FIRM|nr:hypothetical protein [Pelotomaculum isophthalicicum]MDF9409563.1 hypothetical protein [Pelotomaculum isophthalicicum JI]OPX91210.1 MAG: hypothetical protein A4E52_00571 [Pelotomaculum sp. PtaB.Bin013]